MPALKAEYDYYGYARSKKDVVKNTTSVSRSAKVQSQARKPTSEITKAATRNALSDDFIGTPRRASTLAKPTATKRSTSKTSVKTGVAKKKEASLEPVVFPKKEVPKKPEELKLKKMQVQKRKKQIEIEKQKEKAANIVKVIGLSFALFALFFFICYRYTQINESFSDVNAMKASLKEKETVNAQIESNIKQNTDLSYIENYAKYQLGMQKPKTSQIQKIVIEKEDKITMPIEIKEEEKETSFSKIWNNFLAILD